VPDFKNTKKMQWDASHFCLWLPIMKTYVPFHISTIRNISVQHEGAISLIRINFSLPNKAGRIPLEFPTTMSSPVYVQELSFRSADGTHFSSIFSKYKELLKEFNPLAHAKQSGSSLVQTVGAKPVLDDLLLKPPIAGKKTVGRLEYHRNGFRFKSRKGEELDFLNANIKHAIYMPADEEDLFIIHFEMREAVVYGGRRVTNVQFYTRLDESNENLVESSEKRKKRPNDHKGANEDSMDKVYTQKLMAAEKSYESFVAAVEKSSNSEIIFEQPDLDTGFMASKEYDQHNFYMTQTCMIGIVNTPYCIIPFSEIEFVAFERAGIMNKTFDIAIIYKDYSKDVSMLSTVAAAEKTSLKKELDAKDVIVLEHASNIKWQALLKRCSENIEEFIEDGGWEYLGDKEKTVPDDVANDSPSSFGDSEDDEVFSEGDEDFSSDSDEYEDDEEDNSKHSKEDAEFEYSDDDEDGYSDDSSGEDAYVPDSQDSFVVKKKDDVKKPDQKGKNKARK
jgi:nucleosome binding factor SPN SPT16 subunit